MSAFCKDIISILVNFLSADTPISNLTYLRIHIHIHTPNILTQTQINVNKLVSPQYRSVVLMQPAHLKEYSAHLLTNSQMTQLVQDQVHVCAQKFSSEKLCIHLQN